MAWLLYFISACLRVRRVGRTHWLYTLGSVVTTPLLIGIALSATHSGSDINAGLVVWVVAGLAAACIAEGLLQLHGRVTSSVLGFFFLSFALFSMTYWTQLSTTLATWLPIAVVAAAVVTILLMLPAIERFILPVLVMSVVLLQMLTVTVHLWMSGTHPDSIYAVMASLCFIGTGLVSVWLWRVSCDRHSQKTTVFLYSLGQSLVVLSIY